MPRKEEENLTGFPLSPEQKGQCSGWRRLPGGRGLPKEDGKWEQAERDAHQGLLPLPNTTPHSPQSSWGAASRDRLACWDRPLRTPGLGSVFSLFGLHFHLCDAEKGPLLQACLIFKSTAHFPPVFKLFILYWSIADCTTGNGNYGVRNGNPLQYSCLENPMTRGAWQITAMGSQRVGDD